MLEKVLVVDVDAAVKTQKARIPQRSLPTKINGLAMLVWQFVSC